jgi:predicted unusual protein kinase regulating ubiquinone biosynthesis (AarF/ABC1/UbiB family)
LKDRRSSPVPSGRLSRFLEIGAAASQMALGGAAEKVRRLAQKAEAGLPSALLTADNARVLAMRLSRLRGAAMKVGQMLSLEGDSVLPKEFAQALEILRSSAHRMPETQLRSVLAAELGRDWQARFDSFDFSPLAAASIGQVHAAVAKDGRELVLKIQYPGVAGSIDSDVDNLRSLLALSRLLPGDLDLDALAEEVKKELRREVDYEQELDSLTRYRRGLGNLEGTWMPSAVPEHSTSRVLCMERAPGVQLLSWAETADWAERNRVAEVLVRIALREMFEARFCQTDPNPANYLFDAASGRIVLLDFGAARAVPENITELYRAATRALVHRDRAAMAGVYRNMGTILGEDSTAAQLLVSMGFEVAEIFDDQPYDFAASTLAPRMRDRGMALIPHRKELRPPAPEFVFFQRKITGTYLLLRQLGAVLNLRPLLAEYGLA